MMSLSFLPPLYGEGQTAKRSGWGSLKLLTTRQDRPTRSLRDHPPHEGEG